MGGARNIGAVYIWSAQPAALLSLSLALLARATKLVFRGPRARFTHKNLSTAARQRRGEIRSHREKKREFGAVVFVTLCSREHEGEVWCRCRRARIYLGSIVIVAASARAD